MKKIWILAGIFVVVVVAILVWSINSDLFGKAEAKTAIDFFVECSDRDKEYIINNCLCANVKEETSKDIFSRSILSSKNNSIRIISPNSMDDVLASIMLANDDGVMFRLDLKKNKWCVESIIEK